ncbi:protease complex subunit PrcB family protein [Flavobacterium coralii]|uniref:protease complex subunit PrcB family protein n=1 Tax=Flavobacterium coralii TaxID=2838017 RepID=UPI000C5B834C|nr:hypothetical protein [Flavobacterium sp.]|tara:strand:+ start:25211 stop:25684 length:474 start_codon:yes stop_codon:yes gene_type:complete
MKRFILLILTVFLFQGCVVSQRGQNGADGFPGTNAGQNFVILHESGYGGRETESHEVIRSQQDLDALFKELNHNSMTVDFSKYNVVAVFMGQKRSGGYSITVEKVVVDGNTAQVLVKNTLPEQGAMVTMALTAPYCMAAIPKTDKVIVKENPVLIEK